MSNSIFPNDLTAKIWGSIQKNMQGALNLLPPQYSAAKTTIQASVNTYNATTQQLAATTTPPPAITGDTTANIAAYNYLNKELTDLKNGAQNTFDNAVHTQYLIGKNTPSKPTYFADWYLTQLKQQYQNQMQILNSGFGVLLTVYSRELSIKHQVQTYQTYVLNVQKGWLTILSQQLNQQALLLKQLQDLNTTASRNSSFDEVSLQNLKVATSWTTAIFWLALVTCLAIVSWKKGPKIFLTPQVINAAPL